jgi:hypothetical protein
MTDAHNLSAVAIAVRPAFIGWVGQAHGRSVLLLTGHLHQVVQVQYLSP